MSMERWPFIPDRLTDVMSEELVRLVQAGAAVKTDSAAMIVQVSAKGGEIFFRLRFNYLRLSSLRNGLFRGWRLWGEGREVAGFEGVGLVGVAAATSEPALGLI